LKTSYTVKSTIYQALCFILSDRLEAVDLGAFTQREWDALGKRALAEGVGPLVHKKLKEGGWLPGLPGSTREALAQSYYKSSAFNQVLFVELERILAALTAAQMPVIVLKGAALAVTVYPDANLRPMADLDLLVRNEDFQPAQSLIQSQSYTVEPFPSSSLNREIGFNIHMRSLSWPALKLELHWSLVAGEAIWFGPSMVWFWDQKLPWMYSFQDGELADRRYAFRMTPEASLLYACAHLMIQHGLAESRLIWFYDLDLLLRGNQGEFAWPDVIRQARRLHWEAALYDTLEALRSRFDTPIPEPYLKALTERLDPSSVELVNNKRAVGNDRVATVINLLGSLPGPFRLRMFLARAFPSPAYMKWFYHPAIPWAWPLWYLYHWWRLSTRFLIWAIKRVS
jgi:hypothetical protein